jgi:Pyrimidine dimer DNA glycosylase
MRLWSLDPKYLDPAGLVALWRETLLARAVLSGKTRGYQHHPQLIRFKATRDPLASIDRYLSAIHDEAVSRDYSFDPSKFVKRRVAALLPVSAGQLAYEYDHLKRKLRARNLTYYRRLLTVAKPTAHRIFRVVPGAVAEWERP